MIRYDGFSDLVDRMASGSPEQPALLSYGDDGEVRITTWSDLASCVLARTDELKSQGFLCEAILADGTLECVVEVFAAVRAGLQVALIDPFIPDQMAAPLLRIVDADCVWASSSMRQEKIQRSLSPDSKPAYGEHAVLFFTSGTTSSSKAVVLTDRSLMSSAFNGSSLLPLSPDDTLLCLLPLSHVFGFVCGLLWGLSCGATVALGRGPRYYVDDFAVFNPTTVSVVPKLLEFLVAHDSLNEGLQLVLVGAADCPDELLDALRHRGIRASLGYGLTETSSGLALSLGDDFHAMTVCPEVHISIAEDGEVLANAPTCLMQGYYRDPGQTSQAVCEGVLHTGDLGILDEKGLLHVSGRKKDVITLPNGTKVFLPDYESALARVLAERDICVVVHEGKLTLVCGKLSTERTDEQIMQAIEPVMACYPHGSRIASIARLERKLDRTPTGDIERWKILEAL